MVESFLDFIGVLNLIFALLFWSVVVYILYRIGHSKTQWRKILASILALSIAGWVGHYKYTQHAEKQRHRETLAAAKAHFAEVCKKAGTVVYKKITTPQDSVLIMKPVKREATVAELQDQYWMGDPYGHSHGGFDFDPFGLLSRGYEKRHIDFLFVESKDVDDPEKFWRYTVLPPGPNEGLMRLIKEPIEKTVSRYGTTWDDVSTKEDRDHWIACGRRQIIHLETNEVVVEHMGCKFDSWFGSTAYQRSRPWSGAKGGGCSGGGFPGDDWLKKHLGRSE